MSPCREGCGEEGQELLAVLEVTENLIGGIKSGSAIGCEADGQAAVRIVSILKNLFVRSDVPTVVELGLTC